MDKVDYIAEYKKHGTKMGAAKALNIPESTFRGRLKKQEERQKLNRLGLRIEDADALAEAGQQLNTVSTLTGPDGEIKLRWTRTNKEAQDVLEALKNAAELLTLEIKPREPIKLKNVGTEKDLCAVYVLSDFHMGMYANMMETGDTWDLQKAKRVFKSWFKHAVNEAKHCSHAVLLNLGDMSHTDGNTPHTTSRKHAIDVSGRFNEIRDAIIECFDEAIHTLLEHHEGVHVIYCRGNHDSYTAPLIRDMVARAYSNNHRVTFDRTDGAYHSYRWGSVAFFAHHGDKRGMKQCAETFVARFSKLYGATEYRYGFTGHRHHEKLHGDEFYGIKMRQFDTLAPLDAHAAEGGYYSQSRSSVMFFHKVYGYRGESSIPTKMLDV